MAPEPDLARVDADFTDEYPGADPLASEAFVNVVRVGDRLDAEVSRRLRAEEDISLRAFALLATVDGLGGSATSASIAEHVAITTASITSLVDTCVKRGWVERLPDEHDRRKIQIVMRQEGRALVDRRLPGVHQLELSVMSVLSDREKRTLIRLLHKIQKSVADAEQEEPRFLAAERRRPTRLDPRPAPEPDCG